MLVPHTTHSIDTREHGGAEDGTMVERTTTQYVSVVGATASQTRERIMRTVQTADDVQATSPFAIEVGALDRWPPEEVTGGDILRVFPEREPTLLVPPKIAPYHAFENSLFRFGILPGQMIRPKIIINPGLVYHPGSCTSLLSYIANGLIQ